MSGKSDVSRSSRRSNSSSGSGFTAVIESMPEEDKQKVLLLIGKSQSKTKSRFSSKLSDISERTEDSKFIENIDNLTSISRNSSSRKRSESRTPSESSHTSSSSAGKPASSAGRAAASTHKSSSSSASRSGKNYEKSEACYSRANSVSSSHRSSVSTRSRPHSNNGRFQNDETTQFVNGSPVGSPRMPKILNTDDFYKSDSYTRHLSHLKKMYPDESRNYRLYGTLLDYSDDPEMSNAINAGVINNPEIRGPRDTGDLKKLMHKLKNDRDNAFHRSNDDNIICNGVHRVSYHKNRAGSTYLDAEF